MAPQDEETPFRPRSPYAVGKVPVHHPTLDHRDSHGHFIANGILFNHEAPRRVETFVTRKITRATTRIKLGLQDRLFLGDLNAVRDWGLANNYVEAMGLMPKQEAPHDFVIATGESHSVREVVELAFGFLDLDWEAHGHMNPRHFRPTEVDRLEGMHPGPGNPWARHPGSPLRSWLG